MIDLTSKKHSGLAFLTGLLSLILCACQALLPSPDLLRRSPVEPSSKRNSPPSWPKLNLKMFPSAQRHAGTVLVAQEIPNSPDQIVSVGADGTVIAWEISSGSGHLLRSLPKHTLVALAQESPLIAAYGESGLVVTCLTECHDTWSFNRLKIRPMALAFQGHDSAILIAGSDGRIYRWRFFDERDAESIEDKEKMLERYVAHQNVVSAVASHPFGRAFFSADWNGSLFGWLPYTADSQAGEYDRNLFGGRFYSDRTTFVQGQRPPDRGISAMTVSTSGEKLGLGTEDGHVEVWDVRGLTMATRRKLHTGRVLSVSFDVEEKRITSVGRDMTVSVARLEKDPDFGVAAQATPYKLTSGESQRVNGANGVFFLRSGNVIVTTADGSLAEMRNFKVPPPAAVEAPESVDRPLDTDY